MLDSSLYDAAPLFKQKPAQGHHLLACKWVQNNYQMLVWRTLFSANGNPSVCLIIFSLTSCQTQHDKLCSILQADVGAAAAACQAVPGDILPGASLSRAARDEASTNRSPGSAAPQWLPADACSASQRTAPDALIAIPYPLPRAKSALQKGFVHTAEGIGRRRDQLIHLIVQESMCRAPGKASLAASSRGRSYLE